MGVLVAHLLEGCGAGGGAGIGAANVLMDANNESSVFDKVPTPAPPAPTPAPPPPTPVPAPPPSNCCDGSQYVKCCACAAQSPAGFSGGFSIAKGTTIVIGLVRIQHLVQNAVRHALGPRGHHIGNGTRKSISRIAEIGRMRVCLSPPCKQSCK